MMALTASRHDTAVTMTLEFFFCLLEVPDDRGICFAMRNAYCFAPISINAAAIFSLRAYWLVAYMRHG